MRIQLAAAVSLAPLMMASGAAAQTVISTERTTPVVTSTVNGGSPDNVRISNSGVIRLTSGVGVTVNSNNTLTIDAGGRILIENAANGSTGVLLNGGVSTTLGVTGQISVTDGYDGTDSDGDGDLDGLLATGTGRYGVRLAGPGTVTGDLTFASGSSLIVEGNQSAGISVESDLVGDLGYFGTMAVTGDQTYGIRVTGATTGNIIAGGSITTRGLESVGVSLESNLNGALTLGGSIVSTGFRYTSGLPTGVAVDELDADDLLVGGPAVLIGANVTNGVLVTGGATDDADDTDDDDDGILDATDTDDDNDGILDVDERRASIMSVGSAPAILIGSATQTVNLGVVGSGDDAFGFVNRGDIFGNGTFDGFAATGVQFGIAGGPAVTITGGLRNEGLISAIAFEAGSQGILVGSNVDLGRIYNSGIIRSFATSDDVYTTIGLDIAAGAILTQFDNYGTVQSSVIGEAGTAYGIRDASGTLATINNYGSIIGSVVPTDDEDDADDDNEDAGDEVVTGSGIAIDVSANTTGVTLIQDGVNDGDDGDDGVADLDADGDGVDDDQEPGIFGNVLFGSGDDLFDVRNGVVIGDISFGAGSDQFNIDGGSVVTGGITDSDGQLQIDVINGTLDARQTTASTISGLNIGADGTFIATVDPAASSVGGFIVNGTANVAAGAAVGVRFNSLLTTPSRFVIVQATTLNATTLDQSLIQDNSPYMYVVAGGVDTTLDQIYIDARQRTNAEFGFISAESAAYNAFYNNLASDPALLNAFLSQTGRDGFFDLYEQMLPDHSGGPLMSLATGVDAVTRGLSGRGFPAGDGETSAWLQEINFYADKDRGQAYGFRSDGFGLAGGVERGTGLGAFGVTLALTSSGMEDPESEAEENLSATLLELGLYWRAQGVHWNTWARGAVGYGSFDSVRQIIGTGINRRNESSWNGYSVALAAGASYDYRAGRWSVRPEAIIEYFRLSEGSHEEEGGGDGFDLIIEDRSGHILSSTLAVNIGAGFGENYWLRPEIRLGWRQILSHDPGDTLASFRATGNPFTLSGDSLEGGGPIVGFRLNLGNDLGFLALEGDAELLDSYVRYALLLRASFRF